MKFLIFFFLSISLSYAHEIHLRKGITPQKFPPIKLNQDVLPKTELEKLRSVVENKDKLGVGSIEADLTNYTLAVLSRVADFIIHAGLDPLELNDTHLSLFPGTLDLTNGWLQELSTISVSDEVLLKYTHTTDVMEFTLPLSFKEILVDFNYHSQVLLLGVSGTIEAKISNLKLDLHMGFNFSEYHAFVDKIDVTNSGSIAIKFTGLGLLDWLVDLLLGVVTTFLHTLILSVVDVIIYNPVQDLVNNINDVIDYILNPNGTDFIVNRFN